MASDMIAPLPDRGLVAVSGADGAKLLQGLITNDVDTLTHDGAALHAGLLSPQGKILFDFFLIQTSDGFWIDVARERTADLVKRLNMYKLRADVTLQDVSENFAVHALWGDDPSAPQYISKTLAFADPRLGNLGLRFVVGRGSALAITAAANAHAYHAHRIALGVPEGGRDYDFGDAYPHEADFDLFNGVSFSKGCYVGQEVVARMQNKTVVRKRVVKVTGSAPLTSGADILLGGAPIGRVGSVDGPRGLAMVRLDRAQEARDKGLALTAAGVAITIDAAALERYAMSAAAGASAPGFV
jgi:tRNA-modifying protein YgfZ